MHVVTAAPTIRRAVTLVCGLGLVLAPAAFAQSSACVHLLVGAGYVAKMRVVTGSGTSDWSGNFPIGRTECQLLDWVALGDQFSVQVQAVAGRLQNCTPEGLIHNRGDHSVTFFAWGTTLMVQCEEPGAPVPPPCRVDQSPRRLENYPKQSTISIVTRGADDTLVYTPRGGGTPTTLHRCGQHYHCWIENLQPGCPGQNATMDGGPSGGCPQLPPVGSWVEIHTVYSAEVRGGGCNPETLSCCGEAGPVVVMAHHAKVTADTTSEPISVQWGQPSAEWSGSNTGPDESPGGCKPIQAQWAFKLDCSLAVSLGQLGRFHHGDQARGLQPLARLSSDLTHVVVP